jgi:hypothetical protein
MDREHAGGRRGEGEGEEGGRGRGGGREDHEEGSQEVGRRREGGGEEGGRRGGGKEEGKGGGREEREGRMVRGLDGRNMGGLEDGRREGVRGVKVKVKAKQGCPRTAFFCLRAKDSHLPEASTKGLEHPLICSPLRDNSVRFQHHQLWPSSQHPTSKYFKGEGRASQA